MKRIALTLAALLLAAGASAAQTPRAEAAPAPTPTPAAAIPEKVFDRELKDLGGGSLFLSNFRGQVFVLNLWATWCGPCRFEIPELNKFREEYSARGVAFVGLTLEDPETDAGKVAEFVRQFEMKYPVAWADAETAEPLLAGRTNLPQTFVVAPDGRIVARFIGYSPDKSPQLLRDALDRALGLKE